MRLLLFCFVLLFGFSCIASVCRDCPHSSCCEVKRNEFMCCPYTNGVCCSGREACCPEGWSCRATSGTCEHRNGTSQAVRQLAVSSNVCCSDGSQCCPSGTECNHRTKVCEPVNWSSANVFGKIPSRATVALEGDETHNAMQQLQLAVTQNGNQTIYYLAAHHGTICDDQRYECPSETTCCPGTDGLFACCPFSEAVCCPDKLHCCPKGTECDSKDGRCIPSHDDHIDTWRLTSLFYSGSIAGTARVCPDDKFSCKNDQTCCQLPSKSWGCCPFPDAVCCLDGLHCCPNGFQCDAKNGACVPKSNAHPSGHGVLCPGAEFACSNGSTCCSSGGNVWSCCPFEDAVCCPDRLHCCPPDTFCDSANSRCVRSTSHQPNQLAMSADSQQLLKGVCPNGLVACPHGTCCKDSSGSDACCPHPNAVCCPSGHCCPQGMRCDETNGLCIHSSGIPEYKAVPTHASLKHDVTCPDGKSSCEEDRTCCPLIDGSFGCCPLANGTCCSDKMHCCPVGSICAKHAQCVRHLKPSFTRTTIKAEKMVASINPPSDLAHSSTNIANFTDIVHATWCRYCSNGWFCCPNAQGVRNQKCCPSAAGVCCPDGEHCCPRGTRCTNDGHCENLPDNLVTTLAPYLVPAKSNDGKTAGFIAHFQPHSFNFPIAKATSRARLDPLFLLDSYYKGAYWMVTVCPDRERHCPLDHQCCPSTKYGFTCAPSGATCCPPTSETFCPSDSTCSPDGLVCE